MADLVAQGDQPHERWQRALLPEQSVVLGRAEDTWSIPWDKLISRRHAEVTWHNGQLQVRRLPTARNPIFFRGQEAETFAIKVDECFVIGRTLFTLCEETKASTPETRPPIQVRSVTNKELDKIPFRDAPHRIDVLTRLPAVISSAVDEKELCLNLVNLLLAGIPRAGGLAVVAADPEGTEAAQVQVLHSDTRRSGVTPFQPSQRLIREALSHRQQTVLHVWCAGAEGKTSPFTEAVDFDWAFCTPIQGEAGRDWGFYVTGRLTGDETAATILAPWESNDLGDDLKFAELVASILSALRQVQKLQRDQAVLCRFFSPAVRRMLTAGDAEGTLKPRETEVTVLFCDLRGFARKIEAWAYDLVAMLERVSQALGVMTQNILAHKGVIADFLGDAALGFWGWPIPEPAMISQACLAALGIRAEFHAFAQRHDHPLAEFAVGIGIATGRAVAGRIGTPEQAKVTVFGPIVNLASRLEGMTRILHAPILLDEATGRVVREQLPADQARCRRLALVKPFGLDTPLTVHELLPPAAQYPLLQDEHLAYYEAAFEAFIQGQWSNAYEMLHRVPPQDLGKDFLTGFIIQNHHTPPPGWNGVVSLATK